MGSLFKSKMEQLGGSDQTKDLAFTMFQDRLIGGHATFENVPVPVNLLHNNPILTTASDSDVTVLVMIRFPSK